MGPTPKTFTQWLPEENAPWQQVCWGGLWKATRTQMGKALANVRIQSEYALMQNKFYAASTRLPSMELQLQPKTDFSLKNRKLGQMAIWCEFPKDWRVQASSGIGKLLLSAGLVESSQEEESCICDKCMHPPTAHLKKKSKLIYTIVYLTCSFWVKESLCAWSSLALSISCFNRSISWGKKNNILPDLNSGYT